MYFQKNFETLKKNSKMKRNFSGPRPVAYSQPTAADSCLLGTVARLLALRSELAGNLGCARGDNVGVTPSSQQLWTHKQRLCALAVTSRRVSDFAQPLS